MDVLFLSVIALSCFSMAASHPWIAELKSILEPAKLHLPGSLVYSEETRTWTVQCNQIPRILVRPQSLEQLSHVLTYLNDSELEFAARAGGIGSSSANDILISLAMLSEFSFDPHTETITLGPADVG